MRCNAPSFRVEGPKGGALSRPPWLGRGEQQKSGRETVQSGGGGWCKAIFSSLRVP